MAALPTAVQKTVDKANQAHKAAYEQPETPAPEVDEVINPVPEVEVDDLGTDEEVAAVEEAPIQPPAPVEDDWKHKYDTLKGKYDAEVPRLNNDMRVLQEQISSLTSVLSALEKPAAEPAAIADTPATKLIKDEDVEEYGQDMIDVVKRAAMEALAPEMERLKAENTQLKERLGGVSTNIAESARSNMLATLAQQVPDWEEVNTSPEFVQWLSAVDVYAGAQRHALLQQAFEENNAARVVAFFQGYQNEHAAIAPSEKPPTQRKPPVDMASIAAPGKPRAGGVGRTQEGKRIWKNTEIAAFYKDVQRGAYKKDPEAKNKIEADIIAASSEGRITA